MAKAVNEQAAKSIEDFPEVKEAKERLDNARRQYNHYKAEADRLFTQLKSHSTASDDDAKLLLYGQDKNEQELLSLQEQLSKARELRDRWERAVRVGEQELQQARSAACRSLLKEEQPKLRAAQVGLLQAFLSYAEAVKEYTNYISDCQNRGLPISRDIFKGDPCDLTETSPLAQWVRYLVEQGRLEPGDLPKELAKQWHIKGR